MSTDRTTELLNYMSAMTRDIGDFRKETKENFAAIETRMSGLVGRVGGLEAEVRAGFEQVSDQIRSLNDKFEIVTEDLMELRTSQRSLRKRVEALERKVSVTENP